MNDQITINKLSKQTLPETNNLQTEKQRILDEIQYLKMRLNQIGYNGDCAYEKKLAHFYVKTISSCRDKLARHFSS